MKDEEILFLQESNNIEDVWDGESLIQACQAWKYLIFHPRLSAELIQTVHRKLMLGKVDPRECGYWRRRPVYIGSREAAPYDRIPVMMESWIIRANGLLFKKLDVDILNEEIKAQHIFFENIHPFIDGNGRMGRMLMNWTRIKNKLKILTIYEKEKSGYYRWFTELSHSSA